MHGQFGNWLGDGLVGTGTGCASPTTRFTFQNPPRELDIVVCICNSRTPLVRWVGDRRAGRAHVHRWSGRRNRRPCLRHVGLLTFLCMVWHTCTSVHTHTINE